MTSRKIGNLYSDEFKEKVLEYYFRHGGDSKFGLKSRTAHHFSIDHKTISRMLCNRQIVANVIKTLNIKKQMKDTAETSVFNEEVVKNVSSPFIVPSEQKEDLDRSTQNINEELIEENTSKAPVIELPEDPDFSVLKKSILSSASEATNIANLLISGTEEVKNIIMKECNLIFECKVCQNLFRSFVNLLAHKRIYCQEEYANVRSFYHKNAEYGITSESPTIVVEPKPPVPEDETTEGDSSGKKLKIDLIASQLASKKSRRIEEKVSSSTHTGSSHYFSQLGKVTDNRKNLSMNCGILLQDIAGSSSAMYQTYIPPQKDKQPQKSIQEVVNEINAIRGKIEEVSPTQTPSSDNENFDMEIPCGSCSSTFENKLLRQRHVENVHGIARSVFTCPICSVTFLSMFSCMKHLIKVHRKKKHQRERLKQVIRKRVKKVTLTTSELCEFSNDTAVSSRNQNQKGALGESESCSTENKKLKSSSPPTLKEGLTASKEGKSINSTGSIAPNTCHRCLHSFLSPGALGSHLLFCKAPIPEENPKKKIAIQIRKDYKKEDKQSQSKEPVKGGDVLSFSLTSPSKLTAEIHSRIKNFCVVKNLFCIPCDRKYNTVTILKRHAAQHLGWTRFNCSFCSFRSYEKYVCVQHCVTEHKATSATVEDMIITEDKIGKFKFFLSNNTLGKNQNRSINEQDESTQDDQVNGHGSSPSDQSTSAILDDSISIKSEIDSHCNESADVAYRELIDNVKIETENKEGFKSSNGDSLEMETSSNDKVERPQRSRRIAEQRDFVYEPLKLVMCLPRCDEENQKSAETRSNSPANDRTSKRKATSLPSSEPKRICKPLQIPLKNIKVSKEIKVAGNLLAAESSNIEADSISKGTGSITKSSGSATKSTGSITKSSTSFTAKNTCSITKSTASITKSTGSITKSSTGSITKSTTSTTKSTSSITKSTGSITKGPKVVASSDKEKNIVKVKIENRNVSSLLNKSSSPPVKCKTEGGGKNDCPPTVVKVFSSIPTFKIAIKKEEKNGSDNMQNAVSKDTTTSSGSPKTSKTSGVTGKSPIKLRQPKEET